MLSDGRACGCDNNVLYRCQFQGFYSSFLRFVPLNKMSSLVSRLVKLRLDSLFMYQNVLCRVDGVVRNTVWVIFCSVCGRKGGGNKGEVK